MYACFVSFWVHQLHMARNAFMMTVTAWRSSQGAAGFPRLSHSRCKQVPLSSTCGRGVAKEAARQAQQLLCERLLCVHWVCNSVREAEVHSAQPR